MILVTPNFMSWVTILGTTFIEEIIKMGYLKVESQYLSSGD